MKRPPRSFVVEVRRQRRPPSEPASSWAEEALKANGVTLEEAKPAAAPAPVPAASPPAKPTGRILPSLIEAQSVPSSAAPAANPAKPRLKRRVKRKPAAPPPARVVAPPLVAAPPIVEQPAAPASPRDEVRHRRILARYVFSGSLKPGERWKRRLHGKDS